MNNIRQSKSNSKTRTRAVPQTTKITSYLTTIPKTTVQEPTAKSIQNVQQVFYGERAKKIGNEQKCGKQKCIKKKVNWMTSLGRLERRKDK